MKKLLVSAILALTILTVVGCESTPSPSSSSEASCTEPENPYDEGSGHCAGYEWVAEHSGACDTASTSFNEGCDEYDSQEDQYQRCVAKR